MSSASLSPTARAIQRWTVAVCRRTKAPKASSSPPRAEARSSSSVLSGSVKGESRRAARADAILRRIRPASALAVRVGCVVRARIRGRRRGRRRGRLRAEGRRGGPVAAGTRSGSRSAPRASGLPRTRPTGPGSRSGRRCRWPRNRRPPGPSRRALAEGAPARGRRVRATFGGHASSLNRAIASRRFSRKKTASIMPTLDVSPSQAAYDPPVSVKKNLRAVCARNLPARDVGDLARVEDPLAGRELGRALGVDDVAPVDREGDGDALRRRVGEADREFLALQGLDVDPAAAGVLGDGLAVHQDRDGEAGAVVGAQGGRGGEGAGQQDRGSKRACHGVPPAGRDTGTGSWFPEAPLTRSPAGRGIRPL